MKLLVVSNNRNVNNAIIRYSKFVAPETAVKGVTFDNLRVISREILEMDLVMTEVYRVSLDLIDDYGLDIFFSFQRMGRGGILSYVNGIDDDSLEGQYAFLVPKTIRQLLHCIKCPEVYRTVALTSEGMERLRRNFPYRVVKGHNPNHHENTNS